MAISKKFFLNSRASLEEQTICNVLQHHNLAEVVDIDLAHISDADLNRLVRSETTKSASNYFLPGATSSRVKHDSYICEPTFLSDIYVPGVPVIRQVLGMFKYRLGGYDDAVARLAMGYVKAMVSAGIPDDKILELLYRDRMARFSNDYEAEAAAADIIRSSLVNMAGPNTRSEAHRYYWATQGYYSHLEWAVIDHLAVANQGTDFTLFFAHRPSPVLTKGTYFADTATVYTGQPFEAVSDAVSMIHGYEMSVSLDDRTKMYRVTFKLNPDAEPITTDQLCRAFGFFRELHTDGII